ncbi:MAG: hypothetical protein CM1200mP28_07250 [Deltaproteobacteria bacterium]|nr:MAG: hypothetical protein CM1200mP28_07250 [Deltaproteobacteria bacterium]
MGNSLIVIANHHCGNGCQFLAALTKQIPMEPDWNKYRILSKKFFGPIFQQKHSRIILTFENKLHLNHLAKPVSTSGYLPDYWLFPPAGLTEIMRYANKPN